MVGESVVGYFNIPKDDSVESQLKSALTNIKLWETLDHGGEYLISGFVKTQIEKALSILEKEGI